MIANDTHLILGTAGHVDHGKTTVVKALTGFDCDTHREEKERGITIHLGFTHLKLPNERSIGIVDVPGHADFIRTMVAGASGMDMVMLVVAADDGVMPQTFEHLNILNVLGVKSGLVVMTRIDLVEPEILEMARAEIRDTVAGTFLQDAPILEVSAVTGAGMNALRQAIADLADRVTPRDADGVFRMFIDRIFSAPGVGTIVTGSVLSGRMQVDTAVYLLPPEMELRVRRMERFGRETTEVCAGDRAALNLVGMSYDRFERGMLLAGRPLRSTLMLDARLTLFGHARAFALWTHATFLLGTYEAQARLHLLDHDQASGGEAVIVQIHLPRPCLVQRGDRFVIRSTSSDLTLGGGVVIDAFPLHHRRRPEKLKRHLAMLAEGRLSALVAAEVAKVRGAVSAHVLSEMLNTPAPAVVEAAGDAAEGIVCFTRGDDVFLDSEQSLERIRETIVRRVQAWHKRNPLDPCGPTLAALLGATGQVGHSAAEAELEFALGQLNREGRVKPVGVSWAAVEHNVHIGPELQRQIERVLAYIRTCGMKTPLMSEMLELAFSLRIGEPELRRILRYLVGRGDVCFIADNYVDRAVVDQARQALLTALKERPEGITVADFRDLIQGNRKLCLLLMGHFDDEGVTRRNEDVRYITPKGLECLAKPGA
jgi:selenocysteine-specific elongation factor